MHGGTSAGTLVGGLCQPVERSPYGSVCNRVRLTTVLWPGLMGVSGSGVAQGHGMAQRARVRWDMGSSMSFSVLLFVSVGGIMTTLGD